MGFFKNLFSNHSDGRMAIEELKQKGFIGEKFYENIKGLPDDAIFAQLEQRNLMNFIDPQYARNYIPTRFYSSYPDKEDTESISETNSSHYYGMNQNQIDYEQEREFFGVPDWQEEKIIEQIEYGLPEYARSQPEENTFPAHPTYVHEEEEEPEWHSPTYVHEEDDDEEKEEDTTYFHTSYDEDEDD